MKVSLDKGSKVKISGGKYVGRSGEVVKATAKMVVVKLSCTGDEVRIMQTNVTQEIAKTTQVLMQLLPEDDLCWKQTIAMVRAKEEIALLKRRVEKLSEIFAILEVNLG
jgi:RNase P/RNase MRP subunit p29